MASTVTWFGSIYIRVDHPHVNRELALGFKVFVVSFRASVYAQEQYLS